MVRRVELVCAGDELLNGSTLNTHTRSVGDLCRRLGLRLVRETALPDDRAALATLVREAAARSDAVIVSGGLGPTRDDLTRESVAEAFGRELEIDPVYERALRLGYKRAGRTFTEDRRRQALLIGGATFIGNPVGTAPGQRLVADDETVVYLLPGPPREFVPMLEVLGEEWARQGGGPMRRERVRMVAGHGESEVERMLEGLELPPGVELGFRASMLGLELRLNGEDDGALDLAAGRLAEVLGDTIYAEERITVPEFVTALLIERGVTVATAESCTGGWLAKYLTDRPGSSASFLGGIVAYRNEVKQRLLGVPAETLAEHGAVSAETAAAMAAGARARLRSDFALSLTGVAGPGGGTARKPVGLVWLGMAGPDGVETRELRITGDREAVRTLSAMRALDLLRLALDRDGSP